MESRISNIPSAEATVRRQVLTGWSRPIRQLREMQLLLASVRQQCCLASARFEVGPIDPIVVNLSPTEAATAVAHTLDQDPAFRTVIIASSSPGSILTDQDPPTLQSTVDPKEELLASMTVPSRHSRTMSMAPARDAILAIQSEMQDRYTSFQPQDFIKPQDGSIVIPSTNTAVAIPGALDATPTSAVSPPSSPFMNSKRMSISKPISERNSAEGDGAGPQFSSTQTQSPQIMTWTPASISGSKSSLATNSQAFVSNYSGGLKPLGNLPTVLSASSVIPQEEGEGDVESHTASNADNTPKIAEGGGGQASNYPDPQSNPFDDPKSNFDSPNILPVSRGRSGSHTWRPTSAPMYTMALEKEDRPQKYRADDDEQDSETKPVKPITPSLKLITVWEVADGIIDESMGLEISVMWMSLPGLMHILVPFIAFVIDIRAGTFPNVDWDFKTIIINVIVFFSSSIFSFIIMGAHFGFLLVGITDFKRREYFQRRLAAIVEDGFVRIAAQDVDVESSMPLTSTTGTSASKSKKVGVEEDQQYTVYRIPMDRPQNLVAWWYLRACLQDWGLTYFRRISLYAGFFLVYVFVLIGAAFINMYFTEQVLETPIILYVTLHGAVLCSLIGVMIFYGERYNQNRRRAGRCLAQKKVELEAEYSDICRRHRVLSKIHISKHNSLRPKTGDPFHVTAASHDAQAMTVTLEAMETRKSQLWDACRALESVLRAVQNDNQINSIKILGFEAGDQLLQGVLTIAGFGVTAVLRRFL
ncbi:hypothetical protein HDU67_006806 [Dinochytrium kinnereticum]|nr:hypothetical protein HDU67_006806 [Dinochytrium kinnereticum]